MNCFKKPASGFTLLELLVVALIMSLLSVVIVQVFVSAMRSNNKSDISQDVKTNGDQALEVMMRMVQNAQSLELPTAPALCDGSTMDTISITNPDDGMTTFSCKEVGGIARIASTSSSPAKTVYLTNTNVTLTSTNTCTNALSFTCTLSGDTPNAVTIGFSIRQKNSSASISDTAIQSYKTTVTLRNKQ